MLLIRDVLLTRIEKNLACKFHLLTHWEQNGTANTVTDTVLYELDYIIKIIMQGTRFTISTLGSGLEEIQNMIQSHSMPLNSNNIHTYTEHKCDTQNCRYKLLEKNKKVR